MSVPGDKPLRIIRKERFALAIAKGEPVAVAYASAGYAGKGGASSTLRNRKDVSARINYLRTQTAKKAIETAALTSTSIIQSLINRRERAQTGSPIIAKDGTPTGEYREDFAAGNRIDELLGRTMGLYVDVQREENPDKVLEGKNIEELRETLIGEINALDPNLHKQKVEKNAGDVPEPEQPIVADSAELPPEGKTLQ